jgi:phosphatidylinositol-3-phosphatase
MSSTGVPAFEHVYLIMMENESQSAITSTNAPYITSLMSTYAYTDNYSTSYHPSLPNYLDIVSGSTQGVTDDGTPAQYGNITAMHLGDQLDGVQIPWREYAESAGGPCVMTDSGAYATKHVPFLFFKDISGTSSICQDRVVDYSQFATDLAAGTYRFSMISPNLCDDMHGGIAQCLLPSVSTGDTWLKTNAAAIIAAMGPHDVLFIVWDEQTGSTGTSSTPMLCIPTGPLVKPGTVSMKAYTHESLLATFEDAFGVPRLANAAQVPSPINDVWK